MFNDYHIYLLNQNYNFSNSFQNWVSNIENKVLKIVGKPVQSKYIENKSKHDIKINFEN